MMGKIDWATFGLHQSIVDELEAHKQRIACKISKLGLWALRGAVCALRPPARLNVELERISSALGIPYADALLINLDYELAGGACTTAAVPDAGQYRMVRALDWAIPKPMAAGIKWWRISKHVRIRAVPAYVGALCAHNDKAHFGLALNMSPNPWARLNTRGTPIAWLIRQAAMLPSAEAAANMLLQADPVTGGYVTIVGQHHAYWLELNSGDSCVRSQVEYPQQLTVGNDPWEAKREAAALKRWSADMRRTPGFPVRHRDTADLVHFRV